MRSRELVDNFTHYVNSLELDFDQVPEEFNYDNPVLILVDATLSMNRKYDSFVVPRVELMRQTGIKTFEEVSKTIEDEGISSFCKIWNYHHPERVEILKRLADKFQQIKKELKITDDMAALKIWAKQSSVSDYPKFGVKGIGFVTYQYLRLMCGADTTKPDVHLTRAVNEGTGQKLQPTQVVQTVEQTAKKMNLNTSQLDYALWQHYSQRQTLSGI